MSHYEERLEVDLKAIRTRVVGQGAAVESALEDATRAFLLADRRKASNVMLGDHPINRMAREIDRLCHAFVARHVPSARHLRFVSAVMRINIALERIGDYAVTISRETAQLEEAPPASFLGDIEMMSEYGRGVLRQALRAFDEESADLARATMALASQGGATFHKVFEDLLREAESKSHPMEDLFGMLVVIYRLERVSDQAKNICEDTVFLATGQTKQPKIYSVLFIDEHGDRWSQMAAAAGQKAFPESGTYQTGAWDPAAAIDPAVESFLDSRGCPRAGARPQKLDTSHDELSDHHVVVSLQGDPFERLPLIPFHTIVLDWDLGADAESSDPETLDRVWSRIVAEVADLMVTLRGEEAS